MSLLMIASDYPQIEAGYEFKYEECTMWEDIKEYCKACYGPTCDLYIQRNFELLSEDTLVRFLAPYANNWQDNGKCTIKTRFVGFNSNVNSARKIKPHYRRKIVPHGGKFPHKCLRYKELDWYCLTCRDPHCEESITRNFGADKEEDVLKALVDANTYFKNEEGRCMNDPFVRPH